MAVNVGSAECVIESESALTDVTFDRLGVLQLIDALLPGGAERVSVNLANGLPRERYRSFLCTTRQDGPLEQLIAPDVGRISLGRKLCFDWSALRRLVRFVRQNDVRILHAHSSTLLMANLVSRFAPFPNVIWHVHQGRYASYRRAPWTLRQLVRRVDAVIAVSRPLAEWTRDALRISNESVKYIPNSVGALHPVVELPQLPGTPGARIVCVANLRPVKDHLNLIEAMTQVTREVPQAHVLLVGARNDESHAARIQQAITDRSLQDKVSLLGSREDVGSILQAADIAVLSSRSEGLPVSLLEYGMAGLPVVATRVGQCEEVLDHGRCGLLVPPRSPTELAGALTSLLESPSTRKRLGEQLRRHVEASYSEQRIMAEIGQVYDAVQTGNPR